tara:strand:- start:665 stop:916 length:252 start_codon:yes stop_codon:yes gene_type:complete
MVVCVTRQFLSGNGGSDTFLVDTDKLVGDRSRLNYLIKEAMEEDGNSIEGDEDQSQIVNEILGTDVIMECPQIVRSMVNLWFK